MTKWPHDRFMLMNDICLLHWNEAEAAERLDRLAAAGYSASTPP
jgi:hypothetical protein